MSTTHHPGAHLIGSVPLSDTETVFRTVAAELGPYLRYLPDGETGERTRWIFWQRTMLLNHPAMEEDPTIPPFALHQWDGKLLRETPWLRFREGIAPESVTFETGYAPAALDSYQVFQRLQQEGAIPSNIRFQVSLPTPMASAYMYVSPTSREAYLRVYEQALMRALQDILTGIPAHHLAIQWDVCQEVLIYENYFADRPDDYQRQIAEELGRLGNAVPESVAVGYHLCYGSPADEHLVMPKDMSILVEMANRIVEAVTRQIDFLHMPVPKDRTDDAYFEPLSGLVLTDDTALQLGLIHYDDDVGDRARIEAARKVVPSFGVAAECGWGRTDPQRVPSLLASHRQAAAFMQQHA